MKICLLGPATSIHFQNIARGLRRHGMEVSIVSHKPVPVDGIPVERFVVPPFGWRYPGRWRSRQRMYLKRLMRTFDVVHVHYLYDWGFTREIAEDGCLFATPWGADILPTPHSPEEPAELQAARRALLGMARRVTSFGRPFVPIIAGFAGIDTADISVVPLGVDTRLFAPRQMPHRDTLTVGYFKGYAPVYDPETMIRAAAHVLSRMPRVRFDFVGGGARLEARRRFAADLGVDFAIRWIDHQTHQAMPEIMARWDLVAISSLTESYCIAALEASAMELPVVATDVCGLRETVQHEVTGLRVPPADPAALGDAIVSLLCDPDRCRTMGERGRQRVISEFEEDRCLERWIRLYEAAMESTLFRRATVTPFGDRAADDVASPLVGGDGGAPCQDAPGTSPDATSMVTARPSRHGQKVAGSCVIESPE